MYPAIRYAINIPPESIANTVWILVTWLSLTRSQINQVLLPLNAATVPCHVVTSHALTIMHNYYVWRSHMQGHLSLLIFSVLHLATTKAQYMLHSMVKLQVIFQCIRFRCIWFNSLCVNWNEPPINTSILSLVNSSANIWHLESIYSSAPGIILIHQTGLPSSI